MRPFQSRATAARPLRPDPYAAPYEGHGKSAPRNLDSSVIPDFDNRYNCKFDLGPKVREPGTLQSACFRMAQNPNPQYGETYYLMVRCQRKWMPDDLAMQRFALVVQLTHEADINVYEHVRNRARVRLRA